MLLPALAAAREKARRTSCLNNLNQLSKGLESYCGDYNQYFPCWTGYGTSLMEGQQRYFTHPVSGHTVWGGGEMGIYRDPKLAQSEPDYSIIYVNPLTTNNALNGSSTARNYYFPTYSFRCIFAGNNNNYPGSPNPVPLKGRLNLAPHGLGFLAEGGYVSDVRTYFCPSSDGMPTPFVGNPDFAPDHPYYRMAAISSQTMVKKCGVGENMREMMYGDMSWYKCWPTYAGFSGYNGGNYYMSTGGYQGRAALSHYAYRLMPGTMNTAHEFYAEINNRTDYLPHTGRIRIAYTKPGRIDTVAEFGGAPVFKTQTLRSPPSGVFPLHS